MYMFASSFDRHPYLNEDIFISCGIFKLSVVSRSGYLNRLKIKATASNVAPLYCAAHFLEMNDDLHQGKLISKAEAFLNYIILSSWKDTFRILKSCESVSLWSKDLHIVKLCWEAISWKACSDTGVSSIEDNDVLVNVTADDTSKLVKLNGN
ncbi:hypothetical protein T459_35483 [Capsicum annuum]|uniref:Uncharacterized protein n=1 Tax=Capsicum annuum TaxID=4072 RepID=A0A2G2XJB7_CAPAN|nr:hypothetical protein T459_35483 [Capsicum annuum]